MQIGDTKIDVSKKIKVYDSIAKYLFLMVALLAIIWTCMKPYIFMEIDSYALPIVSIQYRGSIVMTQEDIETAQRDMPSLYGWINSYEDLRSSKLVPIDENHWMPFYFPIYAMVCLPMKLLMQFIEGNQAYAFTITNGLAFAIALCFLYKFIQKHGRSNYLLAILLICSPIWIYFHYIGGEPLMFSALIIAMLAWEEEKYRIAALIISVTCMMNPCVMGFGIMIFLDFFFKELSANKKFLFQKDGFFKTVKLCICYIPSLIPFAVNLFYLGVLNPTIGGHTTEPVWRRAMAYFFDLNFGLASVSLLGVILYLLSIGYAIIKKERHLFFVGFSVIFTVIAVSFQVHINSGMIHIARYLVWIYPVFIFSIHGFLSRFFKTKIIYHSLIVFISLIISVCVFRYNGGFEGGSYIELSHVSKAILNRFPELYISFCPSTFNARVDHLSWAYDLGGIVIYRVGENPDGEIRKIMYYNNTDNKQMLMSILESSKDEDLLKFKEKLQIEDDNKVYYINVNKYEDIQYYSMYKSSLYYLVQTYYENLGKEINIVEINDIAKLLRDNPEEGFAYLYNLMEGDSISTEEYVHNLYLYILEREESSEENTHWTETINSGTSRYDVFKSFMTCDEVRERFEN